MTWMWTDPRELIEAEAAQRRESGFVRGPQAHLDDVAEVFQAWESSPRDGWAFVEPDLWDDIETETAQTRSSVDLPAEPELRDRLSGAWWGRCVGNCAGKPLEAGDGWNPDSLRSYLQSVGNYPFANYLSDEHALPEGIPWVGERTETARSSIHAVPKDDDLNYTLIGLRVLERSRSDATTADFAEEWVTSMPYLAACTAERVAYRNLVAGLSPNVAGEVRNPYREWVGALIRADALGYAYPGRPDLAARAAWRDGWLSHRANGLYGEIWVAALISAALVSNDAESAFLSSLDFVPRRSRLAAELTSVHQDWRSGQTPDDLVRSVHRRHRGMNPVHTINNAGIIAAAVLSSENDFDRAVATSIAGCLDTDSNTATVGSVMGAIVGTAGIAGRWTEPFADTLRSDVQGFDGVSVQSIADRFVALALSLT